MKFLIDARLPFLDDYLSKSNQSTLVEILFWAAIYMVFANVMSHVFRALFRKLPIWMLARERGGIFCGNGRDDSVLFAIFGIHHFAAAFLMYLGMVHDNADLWRHGYLLESGFEVADIISLIFKLYPYKWDGIKSDIKAALLFHHSPGLMLCGFVMDTGLYANPHMQAIGLWLLGAAAISCVVAIFLYTLDFEKQMWLAALGYNFNIGFFLYCRFYVFPSESFALLEDVKNTPDLADTVLVKLLYFGFVALSLFNLAIAADAVPKCIRYIQRAIDGVTPIETEAVPPSRDSVLRAKNRRSSVLAVIDTCLDTATVHRRSSLASVLMLNTVSDIATAPHSDLDNVPEEDLQALKKTLSSMSDKKKHA